MITLLTMRGDTAAVSLHNFKQKRFVVVFLIFFLSPYSFFIYRRTMRQNKKKVHHVWRDDL